MGYRLELIKPQRERSWVVRVKGDVGEDDVQVLSDWCLDSGLGRRRAVNEFAFSSKEDAVEFYLRWVS